jgi:hypothetical protein
VALGAFSPGEVAGVSIAVVILLALWLVHVGTERWSERHRTGPRDHRVSSGRERRGF